MGVLFDVHNKLGTKYQEKHYQRAIAIKLKSLNIPYKRECEMKVEFEGDKLGDFYADFVIDDKIILETKVVWKIADDEVKQVLRYLEALNLRLAIVANFKHTKLEYRRIVN